MSAERAHVRLPVIQSIEIHNFSLYREKPQISLSFGDGVFCLAGANGLGKSTFLAIMNYAITGIVANPDRKYMSLQEYYRDSLAYSHSYFAGRVFELERHLAEVTIQFMVGDVNYALTRGMFEPTALRRLQIEEPGTERRIAQEVDSANEEASADLHDLYVKNVIGDTNLASFEQVVFLQHFLLTFDERRHLLFWDPGVTEQALFLAFGVDGESAKSVNEWRRTADRLESQARQAQYQATTARQRKDDLLKRVDTVKAIDPDLVLVHRELVDARDRAEQLREEKSKEVSDAQLAFTRLAARQHALTADYDRMFNERLRPGADPRRNSVIHTLISQHKCGVCGTEGPGIEKYVIQRLEQDVCPVCQSSTKRQLRTAEEFQDLEKMDVLLATAVHDTEVAQVSLTRLTAELENAESVYAKAREDLSSFEQSNNISTDDLASLEPEGSLSQLTKQLDAERRSAIERRDDFRVRRDEYRRRIEPVQKELSEKYLEAEVRFVPRFQELARQFLGLDLLVTMEQRAHGAELTLEIDGTRRRMTTQLSESQRYFVDIALRMALAQHMVGDGQPTCLYIDTPEGSLDIAYENRAGSMFGKFASAGNKLVLTANINSSRLVLQLAKICGQSLMKIERMTSWTTLSEVQAESEGLFDEAYDHITEALQGKSI